MTQAAKKGNSAPKVDLNSALLAALPDGALTYSAEGACRSANEAAGKLLGAPPERLLKQNFREIPFWKTSGLLDLAEETMRTGCPRRLDAPYTPDSDKNLWLDFGLTRVDLGSEAILLVILSDITERKLAEEGLMDAVAKVQRSNQDLEHFAYVASHDLQEPLRMVASYTQLLAQRYEGQLDDQARTYIHYAVDGATRMQQLINGLLTYSRVTSQGEPPELTDSHSVLGEALRNLSTVIDVSRAVVTNRDLPTVHADATQLLQVFQNLIANAIKFRGKDSPHVHVSACDDGHEWLFSVKDNGIGIDAQYANRVFVIFQRLHTREEYPGSGIGLAVCKRVVERHGGRIWFESEPGKGSTFYFTLPK
jgi:PAS domain S-box-containing protein